MSKKPYGHRVTKTTKTNIFQVDLSYDLVIVRSLESGRTVRAIDVKPDNAVEKYNEIVNRLKAVGK